MFINVILIILEKLSTKSAKQVEFVFVSDSYINFILECDF